MFIQRGARRGVILHDAVPDSAPPDVQDTLHQAQAVAQALERLGFEATRVEFSADIAACRHALAELRPSFAFNLVESTHGKTPAVVTACALLGALEIPYSGAGLHAHLYTQDKRVAKRMLFGAGIRTPVFAVQPRELIGWPESTTGIIKPASEDASVGIDASCVIHGAGALAAELAQRQASSPREWFVERFVEGREFNVSLLEGPDGPEVLPIAEIVFRGDWTSRPRIVDYAAKWQAGSFAYENTPRVFLDPAAEPELHSALCAMAIECHALFSLGSYARVDFRVDHHGVPWVLEANANPCLGEDAGFVAAARRRGLSFDAVVGQIVDAIPMRGNGPAPRYESGPGPQLGEGLLADPSSSARRSRRAGVTPSFRSSALASDLEAVKALTREVEVFSEEEVEIAVDLVAEHLWSGDRSGYRFELAEAHDNLVGYACYGPIAGAQNRFDLYWIAVAPRWHRSGLGTQLLERVERAVAAAGGIRLYVDTSGGSRYEPARRFYESCGYRKVAELPDFYTNGDARVVLAKPVLLTKPFRLDVALEA